MATAIPAIKSTCANVNALALDTQENISDYLPAIDFFRSLSTSRQFFTRSCEHNRVRKMVELKSTPKSQLKFMDNLAGDCCLSVKDTLTRRKKLPENLEQFEPAVRLCMPNRQYKFIREGYIHIIWLTSFNINNPIFKSDEVKCVLVLDNRIKLIQRMVELRGVPEDEVEDVADKVDKEFFSIIGDAEEWGIRAALFKKIPAIVSSFKRLPKDKQFFISLGLSKDLSELSQHHFIALNGFNKASRPTSRHAGYFHWSEHDFDQFFNRDMLEYLSDKGSPPPWSVQNEDRLMRPFFEMDRVGILPIDRFASNLLLSSLYVEACSYNTLDPERLETVARRVLTKMKHKGLYFDLQAVLNQANVQFILYKTPYTIEKPQEFKDQIQARLQQWADEIYGRAGAGASSASSLSSSSSSASSSSASGSAAAPPEGVPVVIDSDEDEDVALAVARSLEPEEEEKSE